MEEIRALDAFSLPQRLFPDTDFDTAEGRYYELQNKIAIAVCEYRYRNGMTQAALAKKLGVTQAMVSKYESGEYNISLKAAYFLFDKLGMTFNCTIDDNSNPSLEDVEYAEIPIGSETQVDDNYFDVA